jgi:hypothetical protein
LGGTLRERNHPDPRLAVTADESHVFESCLVEARASCGAGDLRE